MEYLINIIYIFIAVLGWIVAHYFTSRRDKNNKCRELRTKFLIEAYEALCCEVTKRPLTHQRARVLEDTVAKLQLVGTKSQIELVKKLTDEICKSEDFYMDELINELRNDLRKNLGLTEVKTNVRWLRITKDRLK